jgi:hypothetical protein
MVLPFRLVTKKGSERPGPGDPPAFALEPCRRQEEKPCSDFLRRAMSPRDPQRLHLRRGVATALLPEPYRLD